MKNVRAPLIREYLEVCVTQDTQIENLLVPAGTRLLGLPAPADASGEPDKISLMVPNGSIWAFDTAACRVKPRRLKSSAEPQSEQSPQTALSELIERQLELVWLALHEVGNDARLSRRTRLNKLYQALAQVSAVAVHEPGAEGDVETTDAEVNIYYLLGAALFESIIPTKEAVKMLKPLALWATASVDSMALLPSETCSRCELLSNTEPRACLKYVARAASINTLYASGLLFRQHPDVEAMKEQAQRLVRIEAQFRYSGPGHERMQAARLQLLTVLATLQWHNGQMEAYQSTLAEVQTAAAAAWGDSAGFPQTEDARGKLGSLLGRPDQPWSLN